MPTLYRGQTGTSTTEYVVGHLAHAAREVEAVGEHEWREAQAIEWGPERYRTRFQACWDDGALHIRFDAVDNAPWFTMRNRDDHLWEEEVVEIFIDTDGSGVNYAELEINPANVVCDLRVERPAPAVKSLTEWDWAGLQSLVRPFQDPHGAREGWTALARLPWDGLKSLSEATAARVPPKAGDVWRFNVFRIKRPGGPSRPQDGAIFAAWSVPEGPSFHVPSAFRPLRFGTTRG
jgi:Carbohydrate family 9 binding domain-like